MRSLPAGGALMAALAAAGLALSGCGGVGGNPRAVGLYNIPLPTGARIVEHTRSCDRGANAYCSIQLVVTGGGYDTSAHMLSGEQAHLQSLGWGRSQGETGHEHGAESPGSEWRLDYGTAYQDLLAIDLGWIQRTPRISHALSDVVFERRPAISIRLVRGAS
ncbi:MAG: hypothetical protein ACRDMJ_02425 [Solirubrobacteraceae bacterium]